MAASRSSNDGSAELENLDGLDVLEDRMPAADKRRSKKSKREQTGGEELQEWVKKEKKKEKSDNEIRDGRRCKLCKVIDTDYDDVEPEEFIAWGYPPRNGCVQGTVCYYCRKVFSNIYSNRFKSLEDFGKEMTDQDHKKEFMEWRTFVISKFCEAGSRYVKIRYGDDAKDQRLKKNTIEMVDLEEPEDLICMLKDYKHGDPRVNGKGHRLIKHLGKDAVLMPGEQVWKIKRRKRQESSLEEIVHDGADVFSSDHLSSLQSDLSKTMQGTRAVGEAVQPPFAMAGSVVCSSNHVSDSGSVTTPQKGTWNKICILLNY